MRLFAALAVTCAVNTKPMKTCSALAHTVSQAQTAMSTLLSTHANMAELVLWTPVVVAIIAFDTDCVTPIAFTHKVGCANPASPRARLAFDLLDAAGGDGVAKLRLGVAVLLFIAPHPKPASGLAKVFLLFATRHEWILWGTDRTVAFRRVPATRADR